MGESMRCCKVCSLILAFLLCSCAIIPMTSQEIAVKLLSPNDFGLKEAKTGEERYWALYNTHTEAIRQGKDVSYKGVGDISITIPKEAKWIPLANNTDFEGITITVENPNVDIALFSMVKRGYPIDIDQALLDKGNFRRYDKINKGMVLLILKDENPWVVKRKGYDYGAIRNDILLLKNGIAQNKAIMPWGDKRTTKPTCQYIYCDECKKTVKNLTLVRTKTSTHKTMLFTIEGQNNVLVENVTLITPEDKQKYGDSALSIVNCANVTFQNVTINGTYSQKDKYGYGISMNNDWNTTFKGLVADGKWGVFCTNNTNTVTLEDCNLNRFDIHCYGRDITMRDCYFHTYYNQFSSVYGRVLYDNCTFSDFVPFITETSYNCYTPFTLEFKNCTLNLTPKYGMTALCAMGTVDGEQNKRLELSQVAWPNVIIDGLKVLIPESIKEFHVFNVSSSGTKRKISNLSRVSVKRLEVSNDAQLRLSNREIVTENKIKFTVK